MQKDIFEKNKEIICKNKQRIAENKAILQEDEKIKNVILKPAPLVDLSLIWEPMVPINPPS